MKLEKLLKMLFFSRRGSSNRWVSSLWFLLMLGEVLQSMTELCSGLQPTCMNSSNV